MLYGIDSKTANPKIFRWLNKHEGRAVAWVLGQIFDGDKFTTIPGRRLFLTPRGWKPVYPCSETDLARQIERVGQELRNHDSRSDHGNH